MMKSNRPGHGSGSTWAGSNRSVETDDGRALAATAGDAGAVAAGAGAIGVGVAGAAAIGATAYSAGGF
jgi:hypothetical protein